MSISDNNFDIKNFLMASEKRDINIVSPPKSKSKMSPIMSKTHTFFAKKVNDEKEIVETKEKSLEGKDNSSDDKDKTQNKEVLMVTQKSKVSSFINNNSINPSFNNIIDDKKTIPI